MLINPNTSITNMRGFLGGRRPNSGPTLTPKPGPLTTYQPMFNNSNKVNLSLHNQITMSEPPPYLQNLNSHLTGGRARMPEHLSPPPIRRLPTKQKNSYRRKRGLS